ncbi:MAG: helix-turn-helix domain-containing protein [Cytophagales bacterium]
MEDYNKILESLSIKFTSLRNVKVLQPHKVFNFYDFENTLILVHNGEISTENGQVTAGQGDLMFIPAGKTITISFGKGNFTELQQEKYLVEKNKYVSYTKERVPALNPEGSYSVLSFEAKIFDSVNFYSSLDIPPFLLKERPAIVNLILDTIKEEFTEMPGKERIKKCNTEKIVLDIFRYILDNKIFIEKLATNLNYFKDPRLIDIFNFIKTNLGGDLSNRVLANVANVSEDYVGQYFKSMTGINPQDYIEYQRMEKSVGLLRTTKKSIREIGIEVGYKDTAYFCRRFKMMFGISAGKMRKRESLVRA